VSAVLTEKQKLSVQTILDELLDLPEETRAEHWAARRTEPEVRAEVESLLSAMRAAPSFLSRPARLGALGAEDLPGETRIGPWLITGRIGRGGMGDVYRAVRADGTFEQQAAIKLLQPEAAAQLERFRAERQILARFEHPGIARLLDGGIAPDGRPYMVMEFVEGVPITDFCERTQATLAQRLALFRQVCDAVAYAHRNLIVHRDLKPSNILVTADGQAKLLDFGIAKPIDSHAAHVTQVANIVLTPMCAAPEQLTGKPVTTATDVYALGLLLYELITGRHPWAAADALMVQALRLSGKPVVAPSRVAADAQAAPVPPQFIRGDLDAIVAKALRELPTQRYATVDALKRDIDHYLAGEPVQAREGARLYVVGRLIRRYRWTAATLVLVILSLALGLSVAALQAHRAQVQRDIAIRDARREEAVRYSLTRLFRSAISAQSGAQPATAKSMIDTSAQRVLSEYREQPQLEGALVLTLADLYGALEDVSGAGALLEGFLKQAGPAEAPAVVADARSKLANIELLQGHVERAGLLLDQAQAFLEPQGERYPEERLEALGTRAKLQRLQGNLPGAIATSRKAIAARIAYTGRGDRETAILYNSLAISLAANNQLEDALSAYREAVDIYRDIKLGDDLDAQVILANIGTLELRTGHLNEADTSLSAALARERALAGDSAAVAAAMGYVGRLQSIRNQLARALPTLTQASEIAGRYSGAASPVTLQNRLFLGEAQLLAHDPTAAHGTLDAAHSAALAQYGPKSALTLRLQLAQGRVLVATGHVADGRAAMLAAVAGLRTLGPSSRSNLALALEALGEVSLSKQDPADAIAPLIESVTLYQQANYSGWEPATARERLGEAYAARGDVKRARENLQDAVRTLQATLGADHPETQRARAALAALTS
jgi:non-specific serine/threonine protein kinase/serine/threonine-protein kinase